MFVILLILWLIFSGSLTLTNIVIGAAVCAAVTFFSDRFLGYDERRFLRRLKKAPALLHYLGVLLFEIIKENFLVLRLIYKKGQPDSQLTHYCGRLKSETLRVLVANSITLTPGTYTVRLEGDEYAVHALDSSFDPGVEYNEFFRLARDIEEA